MSGERIDAADRGGSGGSSSSSSTISKPGSSATSSRSRSSRRTRSAQIKQLFHDTRDARDGRARGRGVRRLPAVRGRAGGRRRVPREARGALDRTVKAVVLHEVGGPLALEDVPEPATATVVDVRAAGINFADVLIRRGLYPQMPELPHVLGYEVAGELDGRRVLGAAARGRRLRRTRRGRPAVDVPAARQRVVRRRRLVPDDVPDRVHPAAPAGACRRRRRRCSCTPAPAASAARRSSSRSSAARR